MHQRGTVSNSHNFYLNLNNSPLCVYSFTKKTKKTFFAPNFCGNRHILFSYLIATPGPIGEAWATN